MVDDLRVSGRACTRSSRTTACAASSTTSSTCSTCRAASSSSASTTPTTGSCRGCAPSRHRWRSSSTASTSTSTSTSSTARRSGSDTGRAVAEHLVLLADGAGAGGLRAAPHQPSPEGLRVGPQGGLRQVQRRDLDGAAVPRQRHRHQLLEAEPARDLPEQHPPREGEEPVRAGPPAGRSARRRSSAARPSRTRSRARWRTSSTTSTATRCSARAT